MWGCSPSPEESWSDEEGGNEHGEWPIQGIVGEEVNARGESRYEVRWCDWTRADGTSTTWTANLHDRPDLVKKWGAAQRKIVDGLISESGYDVDVRALAGLDVHNIGTRLKAMGYEEMLNRRNGDRSKGGRRGRVRVRGAGSNSGRIKRQVEMLDKMWTQLKDEKEALEWSETDAVSARLRRPRKEGGMRFGPSANPQTDPLWRQFQFVHMSGAVDSPGSDTSTNLSQTSTVRVTKSQSRSFDSTGGGPSASTSTGTSPTISAWNINPPHPMATQHTDQYQKTMQKMQELQHHLEEAVEAARERAADKSEMDELEVFFRELEGRRARLRATMMAGGGPSISTSPGTSPTVAERTTKPLPKSKVRVQEPLNFRRESLEKTWNTAARKAGAAGLKIVNDVDGEDIPPVADEFMYSEREYLYADGIPKLQSFDCLVTCDCTTCENASGCTCQDPSELEDVYGSKEWAYDDGLFAFNLPPGVEVIECNKHCACPPSCSNRVAQRPRDVSIEIFKTDNRGWGARARTDVIRGEVLGIYTGLLIRRETAEGLETKDYCFDLDGKEGDSDEEGLDRYSVDSLTCGNWTRFINHSCQPNMRVYPVVYDTIPEMNMPYLAFVALQDIPARTELTFDYDPAAGREAMKGKGKATKKIGGVKIPEGARECMCGEKRCRGWVAV